jgi:hypothetical protein
MKILKYIKNFNDAKVSKDPIIDYKEENNTFYMRNPSGGGWIEITKKQYEYYKKYDKTGVFKQ